MGFFTKPTIKITKFGGDPTKPVIHVLHGIHSDSGNMDVLTPFYAVLGFRVWLWDYGHIYAANARFFKNPYVVDELAAQVKPGDIGVGHSNGCAILADACDAGVPFAGLTYINPALNKTRRFAKHIRWARVYYNEFDTAVLAGKWFRWLNPVSWVKQHPYGEMGRVGVDYWDNRVRAVDCYNHPPDISLPQLQGHSAFLSPDNVYHWGQWDAGRTASLYGG